MTTRPRFFPALVFSPILVTTLALVSTAGVIAAAPSRQAPIENRLRALADSDPRTRGAALAALVAEGPAADKDMRPLLKHPEASVRLAALTFFQQVFVNDAFAEVASCMSDSDPRVRAVAARVLSQYPSDRAVPILLRSVRDPDVEVRVNARSTLAVFGNREIIPILRQTASGVEVTGGERQSAILSLGQLRASEAVTDLISIAANTSLDLMSTLP